MHSEVTNIDKSAVCGSAKQNYSSLIMYHSCCHERKNTTAVL